MFLFISNNAEHTDAMYILYIVLKFCEYKHLFHFIQKFKQMSELSGIGITQSGAIYGE